VLDAQEGERLRVARELHDSVNQILSSAKFRLQAVQEQMVTLDPALRENSERAKNLLERAIKEVRLISQNLRPSELDDLGLLSAVRSACAEFQERTGVPVVLENTGFPERLTPEVELPFYRLVQEALTNIEKHAQASRVELSLSAESGLLELILRDDGRGFDPEKLTERPDGKPGFGMENMRERAVSLGGTFVLDSQPGLGTRITVRIPYHGVAET
jgi:two-component system NarL family sensor kinase